MKFKTIYDRILVKVIEQESESKILFYKDKDKELITGKVILAGKGKHNSKGVFIPNPVKKGDTILFYKSKGEPFNIDNEDYLGMNGIEDVEAVL